METRAHSGRFVLHQRGTTRVYHDAEVAGEDVLHLLESPGEVLKRSRKSTTRQVGPAVVKSSHGGLFGALRMTLGRARYRRAWVAAQHLEAHGVLIPRTLAYVERGALGLLFANHLVSEFLEGYRDSEQYLARMVHSGSGMVSVAAYLNFLADAVGHLWDSGAVHHDLSGKNIYTRNGEDFVFIDLDDVSVGEALTEDTRLRALVQLYDSYCDVLSDAMLVPFMTKLLDPAMDARVWMPRIRKGQQERRRLHEVRNPNAPRPMMQGQGADSGGGASHS